MFSALRITAILGLIMAILVAATPAPQDVELEERDEGTLEYVIIGLLAQIRVLMLFSGNVYLARSHTVGKRIHRLRLGATGAAIAGATSLG